MDEIEAARNKPFKIGEHDCVSFACSCVKALSGVDLTHEVERYRSSANSARLFRGRGLDLSVSNVLGEPLPVVFAQRGDVVELRRGRRSFIGICVGAHAAMLKLDGLAFVPISDCRQVWKI